MSESKSFLKFFSKFFSKPEVINMKLNYKASKQHQIDEEDIDIGTDYITNSPKVLKRNQTCSFDLSDKTLRLRNSQELTSVDTVTSIHRRSSFNLDRDFPMKLMPISNFDEMEVLGEGAFGRAIKVEHIKSGGFFVLKEVVSHSKENEESIIREVSLLRSLKHINILTTVGLVLKEKRICLLTELMHGGSLQAKIMNFDEEIDLKQKILFLRDIASGMNFLHQNSIMHRDLTSSNCLLRKDNTVVVSDFGLSKFLNDDADSVKLTQRESSEFYRSSSSETINTIHQSSKCSHLEVNVSPMVRHFLSVSDIRDTNQKMNGSTNDLAIGHRVSQKRRNMNIRRKHTVVGSPFWMAPEMLAGKNYNCLVDIYSFGIIGCEVTARISANPECLERHNKDMSVNFPAFVEKHRYKQLQHCPEELIKLVEECCLPNPDHRPTFNSLLSWTEDLLFRVANNIPANNRWSMTFDSD